MGGVEGSNSIIEILFKMKYILCSCLFGVMNFSLMSLKKI